MKSEEGYLLTYYPANHATGTVAFETQPDSLAGALATAWRNRYHGGASIRISQGTQVVFDQEMIENLCLRIDAIDAPDGVLGEIAQYAIEEAEKNP